MHSRVRIAVSAALFASAPLFGASAGPTSSPSGSAGPSPPPPLSAALFSGTTRAPPEEAWRGAAAISGVRMGEEARRGACTVTHVAEWVRVGCDALDAARVDLLAGEKRDFSILGSTDGDQGEKMTAQFSMHPGDRRVIQWIAPDMWEEIWPGDNGDWMTGGANPIGPMLGLSVQVDWASGPEPLISMF